jgi:hypothetical protein
VSSSFLTNLLKNIKIMKTFAFWICTLRVTSRFGEGVAGRWKRVDRRRYLLKKVIILATAALLVMMVLAPAALGQDTMMMEDSMMMEDTRVSGGEAPSIPESGGPAILLPAAALLLGSGILTFAVLRRR